MNIEFRLPEIWSIEPAVIAANLIARSGVPADRLQVWVCPCCGESKIIFAQDDRGCVWLTMLESFTNEKHHLFCLDARKDVDDLPSTLPHKPDVHLLAAWYHSGLYDELARLFAS